MDDAKLWEAMTFRGEPVAHCRAKIEADRRAAISRRNIETVAHVRRVSGQIMRRAGW
jgi:hypothetical protein